MTANTCTIPDCLQPRLCRGWCNAHYRRWRRHGHPLAGRHRTECSITDCTKPHHAKTYCLLHYARWQRHGNPYHDPRHIDHIAVERAIAGEPPEEMTTAEREAAIRRLHRQGLTDPHIATHLDITASGVWVIRRRLGLPANTAPISDHSGRTTA